MKKLILNSFIVGLFSVLCFTHCKKKNNSQEGGQDNTTPLVTISEATLTGATYGWTITGLMADKPASLTDPNTKDWFTYLKLGDSKPTFNFSSNKTYTLLPKFMGRISTEGTWSLSEDKTSVSIADNLVLKITEASDTKIVATIVYPYYGARQNEIANLTITLTKRTQSYESEFPLVNTYWENAAKYYIDFYSGSEASAYYDGSPINLTYTYDKNSSTGIAIDDFGLSHNFSISGDKLTIIVNGQNLVLTKTVK